MEDYSLDEIEATSLMEIVDMAEIEKELATKTAEGSTTPHDWPRTLSVVSLVPFKEVGLIVGHGTETAMESPHPCLIRSMGAVGLAATSLIEVGQAEPEWEIEPAEGSDVAHGCHDLHARIFGCQRNPRQATNEMLQ